MSDDDEMEDFDVSEEDVRRAMGSGYGKKGRGRSREEAMLGVFASRDEDEDSDGGERTAGDEDLLRRFAYTDPVKKQISFVSKGAGQKERPAAREPVIVDTYVSTEDESDADR